jgi:hypothetical protein
VETFPEDGSQDHPSLAYTIPQDVDLSEYNYELDDGGNPIFAGYKLKGTSAQFNDGIYSL